MQRGPISQKGNRFRRKGSYFAERDPFFATYVSGVEYLGATNVFGAKGTGVLDIWRYGYDDETRVGFLGPNIS